MNPHAPFHFVPSGRRFVIMPARLPQRFQRAWYGLAVWLANVRNRRLARRIMRHWATPEAQSAYTAGMNRGAVLGILWSAFIGVLLLAGLWLAGSGL